jgi:hypothetical protein
VRKEEATKRCRQILAEAEFIWDTWGGTREDIAALAKSGISLLRFARRLEAPFFAPQRGESEEEFQRRSAEGRPAPSFYGPIFTEQRQDMEREAEEEQQQLTAA